MAHQGVGISKMTSDRSPIPISLPLGRPRNRLRVSLMQFGMFLNRSLLPSRDDWGREAEDCREVSYPSLLWWGNSSLLCWRLILRQWGCGRSIVRPRDRQQRAIARPGAHAMKFGPRVVHQRAERSGLLLLDIRNESRIADSAR